jgi:PAS domain S-box-containing protein
MPDSRKTKAELIAELNDLRRQVAKLQGLSLSDTSDNEINLQSIIDAIPVFVAYYDEDHYCRFVNHQYEQWLNKPREQLVGRHLREIIGDDGYAQAKPFLDKSFSGTPIPHEVTLQEQDGAHVYAVNHTLDKRQGKAQGVFVLVTDITANKQAEQELIKREKFLSNAQRLANLASVDWDVINDRAQVSGEHIRIFGVGSEYFEKHAGERFLGLVHPKDRAFVKSELDRAINDKVPVYYDYRILREDGSVRYMHDRLEAICNEDGEVIRLLGTTQDITERKQIEESLRREKDFAEGIIDTARAIVLVLDSEARIVRFNPFMEEITGYKLQEVKGKNWLTTFLPKHEYSRIRALFAQAINDKPTLGNFNPILTKDGSERIIEWFDTTLRDADNSIIGLLAIGHDITERVRMEEDLLLFKSIIESSNEAIAITDPVGRFIYVNPAHERLFGIPLAKAHKLNYRDYYPAASLEVLSQVVAPALDRDEDWEGELDAMDANGRLFPVWERVESLRDADGNMLYGFSLMHDISEQREAKQALIRTKEQAEEANRAKSLFLSRMSHELRTPLNSILGFAQLLESGGSHLKDETRAEHIDQILKSGWHLLELINDVLDLAKIEASKIELIIEDVDINERIHDSIDLVGPLADDHNISITYPIDMVCTDIQVHADALRLKQVLLNLLSNAIKYNRKGGSVTVRCYEVKAGRVRISVTDTGSGIPQEDLPSLFQPFNRLYLNTYAREGTGIGLAISKQLVELMGGAIGVDSDPGKGSTFWIELEQSPLHEQELDKTIKKISATREPTEKEKEYDLLYIEDSPSHIKLMEAIIFSIPGCRLRTAHTPRLGLELAFSRPPDLILLDICLPDMDGYEVLAKLQKNKATQHIPVVALSANAVPNEVEKGLRAGFRRYIVKPINLEQFQRTMDELLQDDTT